MWNGSENQINIVFIRHGATAANAEHRYLGKTDEPLSLEGIAALRRRKCLKVYPSVDCVFSSPMKRCVETAQILYPQKEMILIPEWKEMDFGDFEGKNYIELQEDERYQKWIDSNGTLPFPGGEGRAEFAERCRQGFDRMCRLLSEIQREKIMHSGNIGLIVHGGTIMSLLGSLYGGEYFDYQVSNGQGYIGAFKENEGRPKITGIQKIE